MNITFQDPTGDCSFSGQWDGQNYDFNVESLNIMAKQYNAYEVAENLPKELQRAINESKELTRLTKLLPYLSCETPVTFGGKEPPLTCNATTAKELADVIVNWLVDKVRFSLILAWPQAEKNRAAAEAAEQNWMPKPLPFATRIHANTDYSQVISVAQPQSFNAFTDDSENSRKMQEMSRLQHCWVVNPYSGEIVDILKYRANSAYADIIINNKQDMILYNLPLIMVSVAQGLTGHQRDGWIYGAIGTAQWLDQQHYEMENRRDLGVEDTEFVLPFEEFVMQFPEPRARLEKLYIPDYLLSQGALTTLASILRDSNEEAEEKETKIKQRENDDFNFSTEFAGDWRKLRESAIQATSEIGLGTEFFGVNLSDFDVEAFKAILGNFQFFAIPQGTVINNYDGTKTIYITGFYSLVYDAFDFPGNQFLGSWTARGLEPLGTPVTDDHWRSFRDRTGQGGDFRVVSISATPREVRYAYRFWLDYDNLDDNNKPTPVIIRPEDDIRNAIHLLREKGANAPEVIQAFAHLDSYPNDIWPTVSPLLDMETMRLWNNYYIFHKKDVDQSGLLDESSTFRIILRNY